MRLINVDTLELREFQGQNIPKYAILSHTWGDDEVSLRDWEAGRAPSKQGYDKIRYTCDQAREDKLQWAWVDTCCIDKASSAELSEAINSMYRWYENSVACYAYLSDVDYKDEFPYAASNENSDERQISRWFTRAWTLQELIAPSNVIFYNRNWSVSWRRNDLEVASIVSRVTRIPKNVIQHERFNHPSAYSIAQKMSWASRRSCTRLEDVAYSLLGLFNINMPLLYGEGENAFVRLQEELLKETGDHSLFCWTVPRSSSRAWTLESVLARSPDDFEQSGSIQETLSDDGSPSAMTNRGLQIRLDLGERSYDTKSHLFRGNKACSVYNARLHAAEYEPVTGHYKKQISIVLIRTHHHPRAGNRYARLATPELQSVDLDTVYTKKNELIYIQKTLYPWERERFGLGGIHLQDIPLTQRLSHRRSNGGGTRNGTHYGGIPIIQTIFYNGLDIECNDAHRFNTSSTLGPQIEWSGLYSCFVFGDAFLLSHHSPYFVALGMQQPSGDEMRRMLLVWSNRAVHFSIHLGELELLKLKPKSLERTQALLAILDQSGPYTHEGNCEEMYGEIARARTNVRMGHYVEYVLEREDPRTCQGEAAGNRFHFLIRAEVHPS
ncbi:HET-domain-containing protein [Hypoxylon trugodes]|uniref:HET-domain-containing protein n=1 Tax=Hypoxylon trugodes TaxID=326681 RepID=UPI0021905FB0|nr:HET-domain-containing protein [Hypoxylon trugodes]KAI1391995.1 HET-domain-containing protein [Hypoxylon trugodes]